MSATFVTENIDRLQAKGLDSQRGWAISFRSTNEGLYHQLYINGELIDWSDTPEQRTFLLNIDALDREIVIVAVDQDSRMIDMADRLPTAAQQPPWIYRTSVVRSAKHRRGSRIAILGDHATGQIDSTPLVLRELRPEWSSIWGFGEDPFGLGGLGYDAAGAPGMGMGAFGAGQFGIDAEIMLISAPLLEEGTHQIRLRLLSENGKSSDGEIRNVTAWPPPSPATSLRTTDYDPQTNTLTLQIQ